MQIHSVKDRRKHEKALILEEVHKSVTQINDLSKEPEIELLTELSPYALQLTHCIERVFIYGLKTSWRGSKTSFWEYILASVNIMEDVDLLNEISLISSISILTNDGRGRAFLRQSLHVEQIAAYICRITEDQDLAKSWYNAELSIFTTPKDRSKFLALLENISFRTSFNMLLGDKKLNNDVFETRDGFPVWINAVSLPRMMSTQRKKKKRKNKKKRRKERLIDDMIQTDDRMNWEDDPSEKPAPFDISQDMLINSYRSPPANLTGILKTTEDEKDIFSQLLSVQRRSNSEELSPPPSILDISKLSTPPPVETEEVNEVMENKEEGWVHRIDARNGEQNVVTKIAAVCTDSPWEPGNFVADTDAVESVIKTEDRLLQITHESSPQSKVTLQDDQSSSEIVVEVLLREAELLQEENDEMELDSLLLNEKDNPTILIVDKVVENLPVVDVLQPISEGQSKNSDIQNNKSAADVPPLKAATNSEKLEVVNNTTIPFEPLLEEVCESEGKEGEVYDEPSLEIICKSGENNAEDIVPNGKVIVLHTAELPQHPYAQRTVQQPTQEEEIFTLSCEPPKEEAEETSDSHMSANLTIEDMLQKTPSPPSTILLKPPPTKELSPTSTPEPTNDNWNRSSSPVHEEKESCLEDGVKPTLGELAVKVAGHFNSEELYDDVDNSLSSNNIPLGLPELPEWDSPTEMKNKPIEATISSKPNSIDLSNLARVLEQGLSGVEDFPNRASTMSPEIKKAFTVPLVAGPPCFSEEYFKKPSSQNQNCDTFLSSSKANKLLPTKPSVIVQSMLGQSPGQRINLFKMAQAKPFIKGDMIELKTEQLPRRNNAILMQRQNGLCDSCGAALGKNMFGRPLYHYCRYLGSLHCQNCIKNDRAVVPARVIHEIDCNMKKVSVKAKTYLDSMLNIPCISIAMFSDEVIQRSKELQKLRRLVEQLRHIRQFIEVCRHKDAHYQQLNDQNISYLMRSSMLTLKEIVDCIKGDFLKHLSSCTNKLMKHIKSECTICKLRGHFCEICKDHTVIYSFDIEKVIQCQGCKNIFHLECWVENDIESGVSCPKCLRETDRKCRRLVLKSAFRSNSFDSS